VRTETSTRPVRVRRTAKASSPKAEIDTWQVKAECRGPQATVFFPPPQFERKVDRLQRERRAKRICAQCSVSDQCLEYSLSIREPHGIWGGLNEAERKELLESILLS
jgi:WhiB family redox-sensing transcriptional regulator